VKFLADMGVSQSTIRILRERGHEVISLREQHLERMSDVAILDKAKREGCIVLTFDLDFGDLLSATMQLLPSVVIFRLQNQSPPSVISRLLEVISNCHDDLSAGAIVIVEHARYRVRRLPI
jgi:predicted nuclease of predicted toxin-antitoxin system